jgi:acetyl xylan esterase AXE1
MANETPKAAANPLGFRPYLDGYYDASLQLQLSVYRRSEARFDAWDRHRDALATAADLHAWQDHLRTAAYSAIGGLPPCDSPLEPEVRGTIRRPGFRIEKLIYQSLPEVYVTANLYVPDGLTGPTGAVLFVCGHSEEAKGYPTYQAVCQRLARNGLVVLAMDPPGQGERKSYLKPDGEEVVSWGTGEHTYAGYQCWWMGHSIARYFVHDARRALDYLVSRPEVDAARLGVTGNSGGGTQTTWLMLLEPRLAAAAPGTFVTSRRDYLWTGQAQDAEQVVPGGTAFGLDHEDYLVAFAPRPTLVVAVDYDFFNVEGTVRTVERARRAFELLGRPEGPRLVRTRSTHEYHPDLARASTEFFVESLLGADRGEVDHAEPTPLDPRDLWCTERGQVLLERPATRRVFDLNLAEYRAASLSRAGTEHTAEARDWLATRVAAHREPATHYPRWLPGPDLPGVGVRHVLWWSETSVLGAGVCLMPKGGSYDSLLVALLDQGTASADAEPWRSRLLERVGAGEAVLALDVRGVGCLRPHPINPRGLVDDYGTLYKLATDLMWLDDSLLAAQVYDVLRALALVRVDPEIALGGRPVRMLGAGALTLCAYLAAALDEGVAGLELADPLPDLEAMLSSRLYDGDPGCRLLLPGFAARFTLEDLRPLFAGRELRLPEARVGGAHA